MPLTEQQYIASTNRGGNLLVSAAAGSGKTKVLVERLMEYLKDYNTNLDQFLIITYTKAAAAELRGKIAKRLTEAIAEDPENFHLQKQMQHLFLAKISTVHGFCSDVVREYAQRLNLSADFRVAEESECDEIRGLVMKDLMDKAYAGIHEDPDFQAFVDTQCQGRDDRMLAEIVQKVYGSAMCHPDPEQWLDKCLNDCNVEGKTDASQTVWGRALMEELFSYLDLCIADLRRNAEMVRAEAPDCKAVTCLENAAAELLRLRGYTTWDELSRLRAVNYGRLTFPKSFDPLTKERVQAGWEEYKDGVKKRLVWFTDDSQQVLADLSQSAAASRGLIDLVRRFRTAYDKAKRSRRCVDFADLEHLTLELLWRRDVEGHRVPTAAAAELGRRFREIMVDEYQDSNEVQDAIFRALSGDRGNCFMVGDVKQSIYQFRLADPGIFLEKYSSYAPVAEAAAGEGRKVLLSANFRSGPEIIEAVNHVFRSCMCERVGGLEYGADEALNEGLPRDVLPDPAVELHCIQVRQDTYAEESDYVASRIRQMLDAGELVRSGDGLRPVRPDDIVILLRSPGTAGADFQRALAAQGIRCTSGGGTDLLACQEIQVLRSILQTISNPRQDIPLLAVLASPVFGFTADELAAFRALKKEVPIYDALLDDTNPRSEEFLKKLATLRRDARMYPISRLIQRIFKETRMDSIYGAKADGEARKANLQAFYQLAANYENGSHRDLEQFLEYLDLQEEKGLKVAGESTAGAVTIMSIHKSKGLEFPVVFLSNLSRNFNTESQRDQVMCHKDLGLGLCAIDAEKRTRYATISKRSIAVRTAMESLSEEMRVLYVAMTRPQDRLIMTYATKKMDERLRDFALQMSEGRSERLIRTVPCPGDWVLMAALTRRESRCLLDDEELRCQCNVDAAHRWRVVMTQAPEQAPTAAVVEEESRTLPEGAAERLKTALAFHYPHTAATTFASKQTATQRKGRVKDQEAAEDAEEPVVTAVKRSWRKPGFVEAGGKDYGNAMHAAMQYIHFDRCGTVQGVEKELNRLYLAGFLKEDQRKIIEPDKIHNFFTSDLGRKLLDGTPYVREFKFSILCDAGEFDGGPAGEQVLLQGVVDCALLEEDGITVIDFKTDKVTKDTAREVAKQYCDQVKTYVDAMERVYGKTVKAACLYFFAINDFEEIQ